MGEIKSTLDIIMEKTKGLAMTDDEKRAFQKKEVEGKVRGLIQRFMDGDIGLDRFKIEVAGMEEKHRGMVTRAILVDSSTRIRPGEDNDAILKMWEVLTGMDVSPLREILIDFERRLEQEKGVRHKALKKKLRGKGISGSAVLPNIKVDLEWLQIDSKMRKEFQEKVVGLMR
ncbi:MAG: hypothetical protein QGG48_06570 [Desulfatiglandales bacterium]|jgi:hypothetical protein|nr:hypothetical protein [Desulfatiglandales bacterium]